MNRAVPQKSSAHQPMLRHVENPPIVLRVITPDDHQAQSPETAPILGELRGESESMGPENAPNLAVPAVSAQSTDSHPDIVRATPKMSEIPTEGMLAELARESDLLESASPVEILQWAVDRYAPKFAMATAFGPEGMVLIHWLAEIAPQTAIFNLETGYQFAETLELREQVKRRYGIEVELKRPEFSVEEYERIHGGPVYPHDPNRCCADRKISVLKKAATHYDAWASAIRRDQSSDRGRAPIVGWDKKFGLVKVSPLANWTKKQVWSLITKENIPYNPLHDQGYTSIGCWPCTRSVLPGEDERAGRWSGFAKTECGLHTSD